MHFVRIAVDEAGETHFQDDTLDFSETDYRPPAPPLLVTHAHESSAIQFVHLPAGWHGQSFTVPIKQFLVCVSGEMEITVSDGERRNFKAGDIVLMEDTHGSKGHSTFINRPAHCVAAVAPVLA